MEMKTDNRRYPSYVLLLATIVASSIGLTPAIAQPFVETPGVQEFSGTIIVRPIQQEAWRTKGLSNAQALNQVTAAKAVLKSHSVREQIPQTDEYIIEVPAGENENALIGLLKGSGRMQYAEPNWIVYPLATPNDPSFGEQWHHGDSKMQSAAGWDLHTGGPSVSVGICDTGIRTSHQDLYDNRLEGYNAVDKLWENDGGAIGPVHYHGTMVTGAAAANGDNGIGVTGVGWNLSHRMLRVTNHSDGGAYLSDLQHAARTAVESGDRVANVSYSGVGNSSNLTTATYIKSKGGLLVWAAGNDARNLTYGDRDLDDIIVVGATDSSDAKASFSAYGPFVDLMAPGTSITTLSSGCDTCLAGASGTSLSAPLVAGLAALIWSYDPTLTPDEVESILKQGTDDLGAVGVDDTFGYGRINVFGSLSLVGPMPPTAPTNLAATAASTSRIDLSWRDNSGNESGFSIERKTGSGSWSQIDTVDANVTAFADTGLSASTTYGYRVRAYNADAVSAYSNEASATTAEAKPGAPSDLTAAAASTSRIDLSWRDNSGNASGFSIERKTGSGSWSQIDTVDANVTAFADTGLSASTTYSYRVRAYNADAVSAYSNEASATTAEAKPGAPSGLTAAAASTSRIDLSWRDNSGNESGFSIERKTGSGSWSQIDTVDANDTAFADTGLSASTTYTYRVRAFNPGGASAYSNETSTDTEGEPPAAPAMLKAKAMTTSRVDLRWRDRSDDESGFRIDRKTGSGKWSKVAKVGADVTKFSDTGLNRASAYAYRVRALNAAGTSAPSNVAKTVTAAPARPSKLTAKTLSNSRITLSWLDRGKNETGFRIYRKIESGVWSQIAKVRADTTEFVDTGLRGSTGYVYRVRAVNRIGKSKYSKAASAATR
jgi:subtilisin family serine protease